MKNENNGRSGDDSEEVVILKDEQSLLLDHEYDGIRELDHNLPSWWLWTFNLTVIFAFIYSLHYMLKEGVSLQDELNQDLAQIEKIQNDHKTHNKASAPKADFDKLLTDSSVKMLGAKVYMEKCSACHGGKAEGGIGPNLTDDFWLHGNGKGEAISQVIAAGVTAKGMPAWETILNTDELVSVTTFILSVKGSAPANAKAPQGERVQ